MIAVSAKPGQMAVIVVPSRGQPRRHGPDERDRAALGHAVAGVAGHRRETGERGGHHDRSPTGPLDRRAGGQGAVDHAEQVDLDHAHELAEVELALALLRRDAGVEVGGVQPAVLGLDLRDDRLVGGPVGHVQRQERAAEVGGDRPVALGVEVGEDDGDLALAQLRGEGAAEAAGPPGDQRDGAGPGVGCGHVVMRPRVRPTAGTGPAPGCRTAATPPAPARRRRGTARRSRGPAGSRSGEKPKQRMPSSLKRLASVPPDSVYGTGRAPASSALSAATIASTSAPSNVVSTACRRARATRAGRPGRPARRAARSNSSSWPGRKRPSTRRGRRARDDVGLVAGVEHRRVGGVAQRRADHPG